MVCGPRIAFDPLESSATWLKPDVQEDRPDTRDSTDDNDCSGV